MKFSKDVLLNFIGWFLIILGLIRIFQLIIYGVPMHVFWLCNHVIILIGLGILLRSSFLLIGEFSFLFVGQLVWIVGFLMFNVFGVVLEGNSTHLLYDPSFINIITILVHFLTLPLGLLAIFLMGKKNKFAWIAGIVHSLILLPIVLLFPNYNLNCLNSPCLAVFPDNLLYSIIFVPLYFLIFVIPINYLINWMIDRREKSKV